MSSLLLPPAFAADMQRRLGDEYAAFLRALAQPPPVSIRWNSAKAGDRPAAPADRVPWEPRAEYLPARPVFTLDPLFHAGAYYVQEASSMLIGAVVRQLFARDVPIKALDLCAAPGGKSTHLAAAMPPHSLLLSNEVIKSRYATLRYNLTKWGYPHTWTSNLDPERFRSLTGFFDLVLVDAPCSGEGLFRRDPDAIAEWSPVAVMRCVGRQQRILREAASLVAPGGYLVYATCTYNEKENLQNRQWLQTEADLEPVPIELPPEWGAEAIAPGAYQCYPHRLRGEGFFFALLRNTAAHAPAAPPAPAFKHWKPLPRGEQAQAAAWLTSGEDFAGFSDRNGRWHLLGRRWEEAARQLAAALGRVDIGRPIGTPKGKNFVPAPELALHASVRAPDVLDVDRDTALAILRKDTPSLAATGRGWHLVRYEGQGLAWVKLLGNRYNNYYPQGWRIRM
jgi:16S rRNA C967 or C1407 C5-methylase (RsmB/RsmF family)/NOL1/NOP2/fmu family ribosome biogenesis protein